MTLDQTTPAMLMPRACEVCQSKANVKRCTGCQVVFYCSKAHQKSDRANHKNACCWVVSMRDKTDFAEDELRREIGDKLWEEWIGNFDRYEETFEYIEIRHAFAQMVAFQFGLAGGHREGVSLAADHMEDILRLSPGDNTCVRFELPFLYLRLDRDQEAYDLTKWWSTRGDMLRYDWEDPRSSMLEVKNAVVLEAPPKETLCTHCGMLDVKHALLLALVKARLLVNLIALQNATRVLRGRMPQELIDLVRGYALGHSYACRGVLLKCTPRQISSFIRKVKGHLRDLCYAIEERNSYMLGMIYRGGVVTQFRPRPPEMTRGSSAEDAEMALNFAFPAWAESPGAVKLIGSVMGAR